MASGFYTILEPTGGSLKLEELDEWGSLDALPFSLDSDVWLTAGIYGLKLEELATSGGALMLSRTLSVSGSADALTAESVSALRLRLGSGVDAVSAGGALDEPFRTRGIMGSASAITGQSMAVGRVVHLSCSGSVTAAQSFTAERARLISGEDTAYAAGHMEGSRQTVIPLAASGGYTGETLKALRIRIDSLSGTVQTGGVLSALRIRTDAGVLEAASQESLVAVRIRPFGGTAQATASAGLSALRIRLGSGQSDASVEYGTSAEFLRIRLVAGGASALAGNGTVGGGRIRPLSGALAGTSTQDAAWTRIRQDELADVVLGAGAFDALRIRQGVVSGTAQATASALWIRIRIGAGTDGASASSVLGSWLRIRTNSVTDGAQTSGLAHGYLVRGLMASSSVKSGQDAAFLRYRLDTLGGTAHGFGVFDPVRIIHLMESEPARSGEVFTGYRVRPHSATLSTKTGQSVLTVRIRQHKAHGGSQSEERLASLRIRTDKAGAQASASASAFWQRVRLCAGGTGASASSTAAFQLIRGLMAGGVAYTGGGLAVVAVRGLSGEIPALAGGSLLPTVVFHLSGTATATAGGNVFLARVLEGFIDGFAQSSESIRPTYKGWEWDKEESPSTPVWEPETTEPEGWVEITRNAAEWAAQGVAAQGWTRIHGGAAQWQ